MGFRRRRLTTRTDAEADDAERQFLTLARTARLDGGEVLAYGTFAAAARRRFSPDLDVPPISSASWRTSAAAHWRQPASLVRVSSVRQLTHAHVPMSA
jgi:hypothetical protein